MISRIEERRAVARLSDLRRAEPGDATLRNLLGVLNTKLELCAQLPVFEWEAIHDGCEESAFAFRTLAETERRSCTAAIESLHEHLERRRGRPVGGSS